MTDLTIDLTAQPGAFVPRGERRYLLHEEAEAGVYSLLIDNSSLEVFNTCPRSAEYQLILGRTSKPSPALVYGSAIHEGLEAWYKNTDLPLDDRVRAALTTAEGPLVDTPPPIGEWRTLDRCHETLQKYFKHYPDEAFTILRDGEAIEIPFSLPLGVLEMPGDPVRDYVSRDLIRDGDDSPVVPREIRVYWTGKIDLAISLDGSDWVMDHKTTSMLGPSFYGQFDIGSQMLGYTWAAQQLFDRAFTGAIINVLACRKPTKTGTPLTLERQRFYYRSDQLTEWRENTLAQVSDFLISLTRGYFPQATAWCHAKYGKCKYHDVCTLPSDQRLFALNSDLYTDNTWSPITN